MYTVGAGWDASLFYLLLSLCRFKTHAKNCVKYIRKNSVMCKIIITGTKSNTYVTHAVMMPSGQFATSIFKHPASDYVQAWQIEMQNFSSCKFLRKWLLEMIGQGTGLSCCHYCVMLDYFVEFQSWSLELKLWLKQHSEGLFPESKVGKTHFSNVHCSDVSELVMCMSAFLGN